MRTSTLTAGSRGADVATWQNFVGVTPDGVFGPETAVATKAWQLANGLVPDGTVGPLSWGTAFPDTGVLTMATIAAVRGIEKLSVDDLRALVAAANWIGINPDWLATAISFETGGTFSPSIVNKAGSGATGLIQFMPATAQRLGTSTGALRMMSFSQQLEYVKRYFAPMRGKLHSLEDVYLTIFYPKEVGKSPDDVIASAGDAVYTQNAGFDRAGKGWITRGDVTRAIVGVLNQAIATGHRISVPILGTASAVALGAAGFGVYKLWQLRSKA